LPGLKGLTSEAPMCCDIRVTFKDCTEIKAYAHKNIEPLNNRVARCHVRSFDAELDRKKFEKEKPRKR
jgi:hypothetical protein